jgi:hypothetical protein
MKFTIDQLVFIVETFARKKNWQVSWMIERPVLHGIDVTVNAFCEMYFP